MKSYFIIAIITVMMMMMMMIMNMQILSAPFLLLCLCKYVIFLTELYIVEGLCYESQSAHIPSLPLAFNSVFVSNTQVHDTQPPHLLIPIILP